MEWVDTDVARTSRTVGLYPGIERFRISHGHHRIDDPITRSPVEI